MNKRQRDMVSALRRIVCFYIEGFRGMTVGRTLWFIILVKLFIMFAVLKLFFFRDPLAGRSAAERGDAVMERLTETRDYPLDQI